VLDPDALILALAGLRTVPIKRDLVGVEGLAKAKKTD